MFVQSVRDVGFEEVHLAVVPGILKSSADELYIPNGGIISSTSKLQKAS